MQENLIQNVIILRGKEAAVYYEKRTLNGKGNGKKRPSTKLERQRKN